MIWCCLGKWSPVPRSIPLTVINCRKTIFDGGGWWWLINILHLISIQKSLMSFEKLALLKWLFRVSYNIRIMGDCELSDWTAIRVWIFKCRTFCLCDYVQIRVVLVINLIFSLFEKHDKNIITTLGSVHGLFWYDWQISGEME